MATMPIKQTQTRKRQCESDEQSRRAKQTRIESAEAVDHQHASHSHDLLAQGRYMPVSYNSGPIKLSTAIDAEHFDTSKQHDKVRIKIEELEQLEELDDLDDINDILGSFKAPRQPRLEWLSALPPRISPRRSQISERNTPPSTRARVQIDLIRATDPAVLEESNSSSSPTHPPPSSVPRQPPTRHYELLNHHTSAPDSTSCHTQTQTPTPGFLAMDDKFVPRQLLAQAAAIYRTHGPRVLPAEVQTWKQLKTFVQRWPVEKLPSGHIRRVQEKILGQEVIGHGDGDGDGGMLENVHVENQEERGRGGRSGKKEQIGGVDVECYRCGDDATTGNGAAAAAADDNGYDDSGVAANSSPSSSSASPSSRAKKTKISSSTSNSNSNSNYNYNSTPAHHAVKLERKDHLDPANLPAGDNPTTSTSAASPDSTHNHTDTHSATLTLTPYYDFLPDLLPPRSPPTHPHLIDIRSKTLLRLPLHQHTHLTLPDVICSILYLYDPSSPATLRAFLDPDLAPHFFFLFRARSEKFQSWSVEREGELITIGVERPNRPAHSETSTSPSAGHYDLHLTYRLGRPIEAAVPLARPWCPVDSAFFPDDPPTYEFLHNTHPKRGAESHVHFSFPPLDHADALAIKQPRRHRHRQTVQFDCPSDPLFRENCGLLARYMQHTTFTTPVIHAEFQCVFGRKVRYDAALGRVRLNWDHAIRGAATVRRRRKEERERAEGRGIVKVKEENWISDEEQTVGGRISVGDKLEERLWKSDHEVKMPEADA